MDERDELDFLDKMSDDEFVSWIQNFSAKLPAVLKELNLPAEKGDKIEQGRQNFENALFDERMANSTDPLQVPHYDERDDAA